jgi:ABC-2 type transport system permease protein
VLVNATIIRLTARSLLGGKRVLLLSAMALLLLVLAIVVRVAVGVDHEVTEEFIGTLAMAALVPLFGLIVGTGVVGPEIDDGSIVYLLSKPIPRPEIALSKLVVAVTATIAFAAVPTLVATLVLSGTELGLAAGFGVAALVAGVAYSAIFVLLAIVTKHAVVFGLVYALLWEGLVGGFVPGARTLSVQQWAISIGEAVSMPGAIDAHVGLGTAAVLLVVVTLAATWYAGQRLRALTLTADD